MALLAALLAGCAASGDAASADTAENVVDQRSLLLYLSDQGYLLGPARLWNPLPMTSGHFYYLQRPSRGGGFCVFQFPSDANAQRGVQKVRRLVRRGDALFVRGRLAVLHRGRDPNLRLSLRRAFGAERFP